MTGARSTLSSLSSGLGRPSCWRPLRSYRCRSLGSRHCQGLVKAFGLIGAWLGQADRITLVVDQQTDETSSGELSASKGGGNHRPDSHPLDPQPLSLSLTHMTGSSVEINREDGAGALRSTSYSTYLAVDRGTGNEIGLQVLTDIFLDVSFPMRRHHHHPHLPDAVIIVSPLRSLGARLNSTGRPLGGSPKSRSTPVWPRESGTIIIIISSRSLRYVHHRIPPPPTALPFASGPTTRSTAITLMLIILTTVAVVNTSRCA